MRQMARKVFVVVIMHIKALPLPCKSLYMFYQHGINSQRSSFIELVEREELNVLVEDVLNITNQLLYPEKTRLSKVIKTDAEKRLGRDPDKTSSRFQTGPGRDCNFCCVYSRDRESHHSVT